MNMGDLPRKLNEIKRSLTRSQHLSEIWQAFPLLWRKIGWRRSQLRLWLAVLPDMVVLEGDSDDPVYQISGNRQGDDDLAEVIRRIVGESGRPMPVAQLKSKLPPGMVATEPMILAAVGEHPKLTTMGPVIKVLG